jgi:hypothetical protein
VAWFEAVHPDRSWLTVPIQRLRKEDFGCSNVACFAQVRLHGPPALIDSTIQIHPLAFQFERVAPVGFAWNYRVRETGECQTFTTPRS